MKTRHLYTLLLFIPLCFSISSSFAQVADVPSKGNHEISAEQQKAYDEAIQQLDKAIDHLNATLQKLDSMNENGYQIDIPQIPVIPPVPELKWNKNNDVVIELLEDSLDRFEDAMKAFDDSLNVAFGNMKIKINKDGEKKVIVIDGDNPEESAMSDDTDTDDECSAKTVETKWFGLDLGVSAYLQDGSTNVTGKYSPLELNLGKSINCNIHILHQNISLIKHYANIDWGLYAELNNYRFANNTMMIPHIDTIGFTIENNVNYQKNKLFSSYLNLPVTLRFETNPKHPKHSFSLAVGGYAGILIGAHTKTKKDDGDINKLHDDYNLNKIHYGLTARIGYSWFNIYATYSMTPLFNSGVEPELTPASVGIALIGF